MSGTPSTALDRMTEALRCDRGNRVAVVRPADLALLLAVVEAGQRVKKTATFMDAERSLISFYGVLEPLRELHDSLAALDAVDGTGGTQ